jgi:hypothetical protein
LRSLGLSVRAFVTAVMIVSFYALNIFQSQHVRH